MLERECRLYAWFMDYTRKLADGIDEAEMDIVPAEGMNTPRWILGHLAVAGDFGAKWLGAPTQCPKAWYPAFGPGSKPDAVPSPAPTKEELLATLERIYQAVTEAAKTASPEALAKPHTFAPVLEAFPTVADFVAHLMTTHPTLHLGQLSAWRRLRGKPAVLGF
jgi:uncharacterized damage-inducible protein DinB